MFNFSAPDTLQTIVNYVSGVKLYLQERRAGTDLLSHADLAFLDTIGEPPRVSVRRRMVEAMCNVTLGGYDRWYVLAHSLGSVVAYNGLMEPAQTLAHYIDMDRWNALKRKCLAGKRSEIEAQAPPYFDPKSANRGDRIDPPLPSRPVWLDEDDVVYRHKVLGNFRGLLTYGSPIEKFAAIWPELVAINKTEPHFRDGAEWVNIYDPIDPVSGALRSFAPPSVELSESSSSAEPEHDLKPMHYSPALTNYGYKSDLRLLYSHLCYLQLREKEAENLGDAVAEWVLTGNFFSAPEGRPKRWFEPFKRVHHRRKIIASAQWAIVFIVTAWVGSITVLTTYGYTSRTLKPLDSNSKCNFV